MMLEHKKRKVKVLFLSRNAFTFPYVYHRSLLFVSFSNISQKNKKLLVIQEEYVVFQSFSFSHLTVIGPTENPPNIHFYSRLFFPLSMISLATRVILPKFRLSPMMHLQRTTRSALTS